MLDRKSLVGIEHREKGKADFFIDLKCPLQMSVLTAEDPRLAPRQAPFSQWARDLPSLPSSELVLSKEDKLFRQLLERNNNSTNGIEIWNHWIDYLLERQVRAKGWNTAAATVSFSNVRLEKPMTQIGNHNVVLTPNLARKRGLTYSGDAYVTATFTPKPEATGILPSKEENIFIGRIPIMTGAKWCHLYGKSADERLAMGECPNDPLGYFIIKGTERTIITQEMLRASMFFTFIADTKGKLESRVTNVTPKRTTLVSVTVGKKWQTLKVRLQHMRGKHIPLFTVYEVLGVPARDATARILRFVPPAQRQKVYFGLQPSLAKNDSKPDKIGYLAHKRKLGENKTREELQKEIVGDIMTDLFDQIPGLLGKIEHLSFLAAHQIQALLGLRSTDDRDAWPNKRLETAGRSMEQLFTGLWGKMIDQAQEQINEAKSGTSISGAQIARRLLRHSILTDEFEGSFASNSWGVKGSTRAKENITDTLKRETPLAIYSQAGRTNTPSSRKAKNFAVRMVQPSQFGALCLRGDTDVLLGDNISTRKIKDMKNGDVVMTVDQKTLVETPSEIGRWFKKDPMKMVEINTLSDRKVSCDPNHPFLVLRNNHFEWVQAANLKVNDYLTVKNYQVSLSRKGTLLELKEDVVHERYRVELKKLGLLGCPVPVEKMEILARLCGALWSDGHLHDTEANAEGSYAASFTLGRQVDAEEVMKDIMRLGFSEVKIAERDTSFVNVKGITCTSHTHRVQKCGAFSALMAVLGVPQGRKTTNEKPPIPLWVISGSLSVKREYLSGFQGGDGGRLSAVHDKDKWRVMIGDTIQWTTPETLATNTAFFDQMIRLYAEFGINATQRIAPKCAMEGKVHTELVISQEVPNLARYAEVIGYRYCQEKTLASIMPIEFLRYKHSLFKARLARWDYIQHHYYVLGKTYAAIGRDLGIKGDTVKHALSQKREEVKPFTRDKDLTYPEFTAQVQIYQDKVFVPITAIVEQAIEPVYDFTTVSENHDFWANGILVSNCPAESPEGEAIGLVKNLASTCFVSMERGTDDLMAIILHPDNQSLLSYTQSETHPYPFMINGQLYHSDSGIIWCSPKLKEVLVQAKNSARLPMDCCVHFNEIDRIIEYYCDAARPTVPRLVVDANGHLVIDVKNLWGQSIDTLRKEGALAYLDIREQEYVLLARSPREVRERIAKLNDLRKAVERSEQKDLVETIAPPTDINQPTDIVIEAFKVLNRLESGSVRPSVEALARRGYQAYLRRYMASTVLSIFEDAKVENLDNLLRASQKAAFESMEAAVLGKRLKNPPPLEVDRFAAQRTAGLIINDAYTSQLRDSVIEETRAGLKDQLLRLSKKLPFTHSEIDAISMLGIAANVMPQADRAQGPRVTYQASMGKQAMGLYHMMHHLRFDSAFKVMLNPSRPVFETMICEPIGLNAMPTGSTPIVAFLAMDLNFEDAIIVKEEYLQANNFELIKYVTHKSVENQANNEVYERFTRPEQSRKEPNGRYHALDENGIPRIGAYIRQGDCIIGKERIITASVDGIKSSNRENASLFAGIGEEGFVDRVQITWNARKLRTIKVKIRQRRKPQAGDKFASRFSQKGTIAKVIKERDLPRIVGGVNHGLVPDFFINPHSIPSRMTINMLLEMLATKASVYTGERVDATTLHDFDIEKYRRQLVELGMDPDGMEDMELPNGRRIKEQIFVAPCYYQSLRHHVLDKIQMRGRGAILPISHQPVGGRSREGGIRVGEMERDAIISHGATGLLRERLMLVSDVYRLTVCQTCGNIAVCNAVKSQCSCRLCGIQAKVGFLWIPFVLKLIIHMLVAMGMNVTFRTKAAVREGGRPEEAFLL